VTWPFISKSQIRRAASGSAQGPYLRKQTSGGPRYLGREYSNADWELKGSPVVYNPDATISLRDDPTTKLYVGDNSWIYWSSDDSRNANLLAIDLPLGPVITN
jgi:hypothetical protein